MAIRKQHDAEMSKAAATSGHDWYRRGLAQRLGTLDDSLFDLKANWVGSNLITTELAKKSVAGATQQHDEVNDPTPRAQSRMQRLLHVVDMLERFSERDPTRPSWQAANTKPQAGEDCEDQSTSNTHDEDLAFQVTEDNPSGNVLDEVHYRV
jgi:hypothetical protein